MNNQQDLFKRVISHAKEYGFVFQSSDIYDGLSAVYDYGQNGVELKKNIREYWWKAMVQLNSNIVGLDSAIFMHPTTWKASGHVDAFNDPLIDNKDSKKRYRADVLVEDFCAKIEQKIEKEIKKAKKRFGEAFNESEFLKTNKRVLGYRKKINAILKRLGKSLEKEVQNTIESSEPFLKHKDFVKENKSFINNFYNLSKEAQKNAEKDFKKLKEENDYLIEQIPDEYDIRKKLLDNVNFKDFVEQPTGEVNTIKRNLVDLETPIS